MFLLNLFILLAYLFYSSFCTMFKIVVYSIDYYIKLKYYLFIYYTKIDTNKAIIESLLFSILINSVSDFIIKRNNR